MRTHPHGRKTATGPRKVDGGAKVGATQDGDPTPWIFGVDEQLVRLRQGLWKDGRTPHLEVATQPRRWEKGVAKASQVEPV